MCRRQPQHELSSRERLGFQQFSPGKAAGCISRLFIGDADDDSATRADGAASEAGLILPREPPRYHRRRQRAVTRIAASEFIYYRRL